MQATRRYAAWLVSLVLLALAGCGPTTRPPAPAGEQAPFPASIYRQAALDGQPVYRVATELSRVETVVRRDGPLARFGHDHVIVAQEIEGYVLAPGDLADAQGDLRIDLETMEVDPADARARHQLDTQPDADDIAGTRSNMLEKVLEARRWPHAAIRIDKVTGALPRVEARVLMQLHGVDRQFRVPIKVQFDDSHFTAEGTFELLQSDFGIEPFSILGGGLGVANQLELHFRITANRVQADL